MEILRQKLQDKHTTIAYCRNGDDVSGRGAELFEQLAKGAITSRGRFTMAMSGCVTTMALYAGLGSNAYRKSINWSNVHLFWTDSSCNRTESRNTHYEMLEDVLLSRVPIPRRNVYAAPAENSDCQRAAAEYEQTLRAFFELDAGQLPRFDLITLELAPDGHVASLFPGTSALEETTRFVATSYIHPLNEHRITLTPPVIGNAANVMLLAVGRRNASALQEALTDKHLSAQVPSQLIRPTNGKLYYFIDPMAAGKLQPTAI